MSLSPRDKGINKSYVTETVIKLNILNIKWPPKAMKKRFGMNMAFLMH